MNPTDRIWSLLAKPPKPPSKQWARDLIDDPRSTELQKRMAKEALEPRMGRQRIPGEDDQ